MTVVLRIVRCDVSAHRCHRHGYRWLIARCHVVVYRRIEVEGRMCVHEITASGRHAKGMLLELCWIVSEVGEMLWVVLRNVRLWH